MSYGLIVLKQRHSMKMGLKVGPIMLGFSFKALSTWAKHSSYPCASTNERLESTWTFCSALGVASHTEVNGDVNVGPDHVLCLITWAQCVTNAFFLWTQNELGRRNERLNEFQIKRKRERQNKSCHFHCYCSTMSERYVKSATLTGNDGVNESLSSSWPSFDVLFSCSSHFSFPIVRGVQHGMAQIAVTFQNYHHFFLKETVWWLQTHTDSSAVSSLPEITVIPDLL